MPYRYLSPLSPLRPLRMPASLLRCYARARREAAGACCAWWSATHATPPPPALSRGVPGRELGRVLINQDR